MRKSFVLLLAVLALLTMAGNVVTAQDGEPLVIGLLNDESGGLAVYGFELEYGFKLGLLYEAGIEPADYDYDIDAALADLTIAGRPVVIEMRDNAGDPDTGATQARELIEQAGAEILVGAPSSGVTVGLQQVALDSDVLLFAGPAASPGITGANFNPNTFRVCRNSVQDALALGTFAPSMGQNWVILAADYEFGRASAGAFQAVLGAYGVTVVSEPIYAPLETTDFTAYIQQVLDSGADVVLPIWAGATTVTLYQQFAELGVAEQMTIVGAFNSNDFMLATSDPSQIGTVAFHVYHYTYPQNEINDWLVENHRAVYNDVPDLFTECGFATAQALVMAVEATGGDTLPESLTPELEGLFFEGPKGTYAIRPSDHQALVPMYISRLLNLDDPDFAFYELLAELPFYQMVPPLALPEAYADRASMDEEFNAEVAEYAAADMEVESEATP
jgi:branched-chain amino acid transport system substrate-binding protein